MQISALRNNEIDAAIVSTPLEEAGIKEYPLFYEPFVGYFHEGEKALKKRWNICVFNRPSDFRPAMPKQHIPDRIYGTEGEKKDIWELF